MARVRSGSRRARDQEALDGTRRHIGRAHELASACVSVLYSVECGAAKTSGRHRMRPQRKRESDVRVRRPLASGRAHPCTHRVGAVLRTLSAAAAIVMVHVDRHIAKNCGDVK